MKHLFIVNPVAGKGKPLKIIPEIKELFKKSSQPYFIEQTKYPGHATEIVKKYVSNDTFRVYSVGGDGTLNEVVNGIAGSDSILGIIPLGSGNDFIKTFYPEYNVDTILCSTLKGTEVSIDLAKANDKYYINIASIGMDAEVAFHTNKFKNLPLVSGKLAYILGVFYTLIHSTSYSFKVDMYDHKIQGDSLLITFSNGKYYGGGILPTPDADLTDGLFDICHCQAMGKFKILYTFPKIMKGTHGKSKFVTFYRKNKVLVESEKPIALNLDGEISKATKILFEIIPLGIKLILPATCDKYDYL